MLQLGRARANLGKSIQAGYRDNSINTIRIHIQATTAF